MFLAKIVEIKENKNTVWSVYIYIYTCKITYKALKKIESITKTRIEEENMGHGKDIHFLLIALTVM